MEHLNEKELNESLLKCRCCFRLMIDDQETVEIDDFIKQTFKFLTNMDVI